MTAFFGESAARPLIAGHRGYRALYPENTMLSYALHGYTGAGVQPGACRGYPHLRFAPRQRDTPAIDGRTAQNRGHPSGHGAAVGGAGAHRRYFGGPGAGAVDAFYTPSVALSRFAARHLPQTASLGAILTAAENCVNASTKPSVAAKVAPSEARRNGWGRCRVAAEERRSATEGVKKYPTGEQAL